MATSLDSSHPFPACQPVNWEPNIPSPDVTSVSSVWSAMQETNHYLSQFQQAQQQADQACNHVIMTEAQKAAEACDIDGSKTDENAILDAYRNDLIAGKDPKKAREELEQNVEIIQQAAGKDGICIFRQVHYNGKKVSDKNIKKVAQRIANKLDKDVQVTSGNRDFVPKGSSRSSLHMVGRAVDFHIDGYSNEQAFAAILEDREEIFDEEEGYHFIHHGPHTGTGGPHLHIDHSQSGSTLLISEEGMSPETANKYPRHPLEELSDPLP